MTEIASVSKKYQVRKKKEVLEEAVEAPVEQGQQIGKIVMKLGNEIVGECPVTAAESVERMTILKSLELFLKNLVGMK